MATRKGSASRTGCSVVCCSNSYRYSLSVRMYSIPKTPERCRQWLEFCMNPRMDGIPPELLHKRRKICNNHFADQCWMNTLKTSLVHDAVPSICRVRGCSFHKNYVPSKPTNIVTIIFDEDLQDGVDKNLSSSPLKRRGRDGNFGARSSFKRSDADENGEQFDELAVDKSQLKRGRPRKMIGQNIITNSMTTTDTIDESAAKLAACKPLSVKEKNKKMSELIYSRHLSERLFQLPTDQASLGRKLIDQVLSRAGLGTLQPHTRLTDELATGENEQPLVQYVLVTSLNEDGSASSPDVLMPISTVEEMSAAANSTPEMMTDISPEVVYNMSPEMIASISPEEMGNVAPEEMANISPEDNISPEMTDILREETANILTEVTDNISPEIIDNISPEVIDNISSEVMDHISPEVMDHISPEVMDHISPDLIAIDHDYYGSSLAP